MTELGAMLMDCRAIEGEDRLILYAWAAQIEEGNDMLFCSKETVADFLGLTVRTIQRRTKALVKLGLMIDTGERKQWRFGWTPVYTINVPMIVELFEAQADNLSPRDKMSPRQIVTQGSDGLSGFRFNASSSAYAEATSTTLGGDTGFQPVVVGASLHGKVVNLKPENLKTNSNTKTKTNNKTCKKCGDVLVRDKNHACLAKPFVESTRYDFDGFDDDIINMRGPNPDDLGEEIEVMEDGSHGPISRKQGSMDQAVSQKAAESTGREGSATPTAARFDSAPRSAAPPLTEEEVVRRYPEDEIWDSRGRTRDTPAGRAWAASRGVEILPSISS
jgi:hypothetical protein